MTDIAGLTEFVEISAQNRDFSLFFSGREDEIAELHKRSQVVLRTTTSISTPGGSTTIIQGCPGIGKTSLLGRFIDLCNEDYRENGRNGTMPLPLNVHVSEATDLKTILDRAILANPTNRTMNWLSGLGADLLNRLKLSSTLENLLDLLKVRTGERPLVILIDEIQNASDKNRDFLSSLHEGQMVSLPILPVYFGLNNSKSQLETLGLSRLGDEAIINLGMLTIDDCTHSFQSMLDKYEIERSQLTQEWIHSMVQDSKCFPHHLTAALRATASVLLESKGQMNRDGLNSARKRAETYRLNFYKDRVGYLETLPEEAVGALARSLAADPLILGRHPARATAALSKILDGLEDTPSSMDVASMLQTMIHRGILQLDASQERYVIPIPSFQSWAAENL